jgi:hypothetical protein
MRRVWTYTAAAAASMVVYRLVVTPWQQRWGATDAEVDASLPGDELVAEPATQATRAITVAAPPEEVWRWVIQLGADRGGFYSYDLLEDLFGLGIHSADEVVPEWQHRMVGDLVYGDAAGRGGWYVMDVRPDEALVLKMANVEAGRPVRRDEGLRWEFLWTFVVRERPDGSSRLIVRERTAFDRALTQALLSPLGLVSFVMTQKMLRGIKARAERSADASRVRTAG